MTLPSSYIELSLLQRSRPRSDAFAAELFFVACGFSAQDVVRTKSRGTVGASVYVSSGQKANSVRRAFEAFKPRGWRWRERVLSPEDWFTKWQTAYAISPLGKKFTVVPYWQKERFKGKRLPVYIDPKGHFGSGTHETTRIVVALMERFEGKFDAFLDAGTGTGILLVVAAHLGAVRVAGFDEDPGALVSARANLAYNCVKGTLRRHDVNEEKGQYDLVAANLISNCLVGAQKALARSVKKGGVLAVSGIEKRNFKWFLKNFRPPGLRKIAVISGRGWCGAAYRREGI